MDHLEGAGGHDGVFYLVDLLEGLCECVYICLHIMMSPLSQKLQLNSICFSCGLVNFRLRLRENPGKPESLLNRRRLGSSFMTNVLGHFPLDKPSHS